MRKIQLLALVTLLFSAVQLRAETNSYFGFTDVNPVINTEKYGTVYDVHRFVSPGFSARLNYDYKKESSLFSGCSNIGPVKANGVLVSRARAVIPAVEIPTSKSYNMNFVFAPVQVQARIEIVDSSMNILKTVNTTGTLSFQFDYSKHVIIGKFQSNFGPVTSPGLDSNNTLIFNLSGKDVASAISTY